MLFLKEKQKGFTLIEMLVSMSIIALLLTVSVASFRSGQQDDILRFATQRLADALSTAQSDAIAGRVPTIPAGRTTPPPAFGLNLSVNTIGTLAQGQLFADTNGAASNFNYDVGEATGPAAAFDPRTNRPSIIIKSIVPVTGTTQAPIFGTPIVTPLNIAFTSPQGLIKFNGQDTPNTIVITLQHTGTGRTKTVTINRITGRIDAQY